MMIRTGKPGSETHADRVRTRVHRPKMAACRRRGLVLSTFGASAAAALMILAAAPTSFAAAGIVPGFLEDGSAPTHTTSAEMPGMNHGAAEAPASAPAPTMSDDMPGMEHGSADAPASTPTPTMSDDMPGMEHGSGDAPEPAHGAGDAAESPDRPLAAVLGTFGGGTAAVMVTAGFLRKKDRAADEVKAAARLARRSQK